MRAHRKDASRSLLSFWPRLGGLSGNSAEHLAFADHRGLVMAAARQVMHRSSDSVRGEEEGHSGDHQYSIHDYFHFGLLVRLWSGLDVYLEGVVCAEGVRISKAFPSHHIIITSEGCILLDKPLRQGYEASIARLPFAGSRSWCWWWMRRTPAGPLVALNPPVLVGSGYKDLTLVVRSVLIGTINPEIRLSGTLDAAPRGLEELHGEDLKTGAS